MAFLNLDGLRYFYQKLLGVFAKDNEVVKSVNSVTPMNGNVEISRVDYADNLVADDAQASSGSFIIRTSGGDASISDGDASLTTLKGTSTHTGYSAGSLEMTVSPVSVVPRTGTITVAPDSSDFKDTIREDASITFTYDGGWDIDPTYYGITISGTPDDSDTITASYVKATDTTSVSTTSESITVSINSATFEYAILSDAEVTFNYTSSWDNDPEDYGLTITGTPVSGDTITAEYAKRSDTLTVTVNAASTVARDGTLTATIDADVWAFSNVSEGTTTFTYSSDWDDDPEDYGITLTGTPASGDTITVVYTAEVRGTIAHPQLGSFVSTGWNLYDRTAGYARCLKYSNTYGFLIGGTFTSIAFSETATGTRTSITPVLVDDGVYSFDVDTDGYVFVTGGDETTYIMMTWSDWTDGYEGEFETFTTSVVDLSSLRAAFPYGLMAAGGVADEVDFTYNSYTSRVERMAYNYTNLIAAKNSGRQYEYDEDYIYIERETYVTDTMDIDSAYTVSDHGLEFFEDTDAPMYASMLYGQNLKDKLRTDVLTISAQDLTSTQQAQVQYNIGTVVTNNLTTTTSGKVLDARQGKALNDSISSLNDSLANLTTTVSGKKNTQTAVSDPSASGTSATFIATISQDAQGVITPTKKTVRTMSAASADAAGATGLVPAPAAGKQAAFLRGDGTWNTPTNTQNTAGTTASAKKLFLVGALSQTTAPQTYSNVSCYASGGYLFSGGAKVLTSATDTQNTAGTSNSTKKLYLAGALSQTTAPQTYSNVSCYASGGYLFSGGSRTVTIGGPAIFKVVNYSYDYTSLSSGSYLNVTATNLGISTPSGYTALGLRYAGTGSTNCCLVTVNPFATGSSTAVGVRNVSSSSVSSTVGFNIIYVREDLI